MTHATRAGALHVQGAAMLFMSGNITTTLDEAAQGAAFSKYMRLMEGPRSTRTIRSSAAPNRCPLARMDSCAVEQTVDRGAGIGHAHGPTTSHHLSRYLNLYRYVYVYIRVYLLVATKGMH